MNAINGNYKSIREELEEFGGNIRELNNTKSIGTSNANKLERTINGRTYNAKIIKSRWFKVPEVVIKDSKGKEIMRCEVKSFDESKLEHVILKNQWKERKGFSMEQKAQLCTAANGHKVGKSDKQVNWEDIKKDCLEIVHEEKAPLNEKADALLGLCAIYNGLSKEEQGSFEHIEVAKVLSGGENFPNRIIANDLFDALKDPSLSKKERDKAMELLGKIYNNPAIPDSTKEAIGARVQADCASNKFSSLDAASLSWHLGQLRNQEMAEIVSEGLFDIIKNPELPQEEREKAGELLGKIYNDPEVPKSIRKEIASQVREIAKSMVCDMARINSGATREVMDQITSGWGLPDGVIPQVQDPVANKVLWPGTPLFQYGTMNPDTKLAKAKGITLNKDGIITNSTKECLTAQYPGCKIREKSVECNGNKHTAFLITNPGVPNDPPIVVMDFGALNADSLASLNEKLRSGGTDAKEALRIKFGVKEDDPKSQEKVKKFTKQQRPMETKDELLSAMNTVCSEYETTLKEASDYFNLLAQMGIGKMVGVFSEDREQNQGFSMKLTSTQGLVGLMDNKKNSKKALNEAISNAIKKGYVQDMSLQEQAIIVRAAKIATGKDMTFKEIVAQFQG